MTHPLPTQLVQPSIPWSRPNRNSRSAAFSVKRQRVAIGLARLLVAAQPPQEIGLRRRQVAIARQAAVGLERFDLGQRRLGPSTIATTTARLSATTGDGQTRSSAS